MEFERSSRRRPMLQLTPLIDVMLILIIFFMLTTSFIRLESLELVLPSAGKPSSKKEVAGIFIRKNGEILLGDKIVEQEELSSLLIRSLNRNPETTIVLFSAEGVSMQQLVAVIDKVTISGAKNLYVRKWEAGGS